MRLRLSDDSPEGSSRNDRINSSGSISDSYFFAIEHLINSEYGIAVAVSVFSDTDRPGFHRREAVPAQTMRNGLQLSLPHEATFLRCREGIGRLSRTKMLLCHCHKIFNLILEIVVLFANGHAATGLHSVGSLLCQAHIRLYKCRASRLDKCDIVRSAVLVYI